MGRNPNVIIVGGGIMGASAAWHLARAGAQVTVLEALSERGGSVTLRSYGWVGTGSRLPSKNPAAFALESEALREFTRLERDLGALPIAARGALVWRADEHATAALITEQRAAGIVVDALSTAGIAALEPCLAAPPRLAAWLPGDIAVEAAPLARLFLDSAEAAGARFRSVTVAAIETRGGRVTGVKTSGETIAADIVVLANGHAALALTAPIGLDLKLRQEPAVLLRYAAEPVPLRHLLDTPAVELRPGSAGGLVSAADYPDTGAAGLPALGQRITAHIAELFAPRPKLTLLSVAAAQRPMTESGDPLRGFVEGIEGLYALVAHPGVILAPLLGRHAATDIVGA